MNIMGVGSLELLVVLVVALVVLGPERLVSVGRTIGRFIGEFRRTTAGLSRTLQDVVDEESFSGDRVSEEGFPPESQRFPVRRDGSTSRSGGSHVGTRRPGKE